MRLRSVSRKRDQVHRAPVWQRHRTWSKTNVGPELTGPTLTSLRGVESADLQIVRHREYSGDGVRSQSGYIPIHLVHYRSFKSHMPAVHNDVNLRDSSHRIP